MIPRILGAGVIMALAAILVQMWTAKQGYEVETQQTMVFTTLCFVQLSNALSVRFSFHSILTDKLFTNWRLWGAIALTVGLQFMLVCFPALKPFFSTTALDASALDVISVTVPCSVLLL